MSCGYVNAVYECEMCHSWFNSDEDGRVIDDIAFCQNCLDRNGRRIIPHDRKTNIKVMRRNAHNGCGEAQPFMDDTKDAENLQTKDVNIVKRNDFMTNILIVEDEKNM